MPNYKYIPVHETNSDRQSRQAADQRSALRRAEIAARRRKPLSEVAAELLGPDAPSHAARER